jgi:peptidoglycan hydrolase CwlO-like protein
MKPEENTGTTYRNEPTDGKSNGSVIAFVTVLIILLGLGIVGFTMIQKKHNTAMNNLEHEKLALANQLSDRDSVINQWVTSFNEVESNIMKITARENMLRLQSQNMELPKDKKAEILKELQYVQDMITQNKKRISTLRAELHRSGLKIAALQAKIDTLGNDIAMRDQEIASLKTDIDSRNFQIGQLNQKVDNMGRAIESKDSTIAQKTGELNKGFVAYGTYKDLKRKGLVTKEGGVLGLGKTESMESNFHNDSLFTQVDITKITTLPVNSKSAKLVTEHPQDSYTMVKDGNHHIAYIAIKNPEQFWKLSKYAVVELSN